MKIIGLIVIGLIVLVMNAVLLWDENKKRHIVQINRSVQDEVQRQIESWSERHRLGTVYDRHDYICCKRMHNGEIPQVSVTKREDYMKEVKIAFRK